MQFDHFRFGFLVGDANRRFLRHADQLIDRQIGALRFDLADADDLSGDLDAEFGQQLPGDGADMRRAPPSRGRSNAPAHCADPSDYISGRRSDPHGRDADGAPGASSSSPPSIGSTFMT